jgi:ABC-type transport system involved in multi-copper enzyme maturation permease subunit
MMFPLLRKDWRLNRVVVIAALVMSVLPYGLSLGNVVLNPPEYRAVTSWDYLDAIQLAAGACLILMVPLAAAFGGTAFAAERRDRTAEFLGMLPAPRGQIIASKLVVAAACVAVLISVHLAIIVACNVLGDITGTRGRHGVSAYDAGAMAACFAVALFGLAWAASTVIRSPAIAASAAIGVGVGILFGGISWGERLFRMFERVSGVRASETVILTTVSAFAAALGVAAIAVSSVYYAKRVEP